LSLSALMDALPAAYTSMSHPFFRDAGDLTAPIERIARVGAASLPLLEEAFRLRLWSEAEGYRYIPEEEFVGSGEKLVHQQMGSFESFPPGSAYLELQKAFQGWLDERLHNLSHYPFSSQLIFNSLSLQKYEQGSIGITPHRDGLRYINLVCVFVIAGQGRFFVCADRSGREALEIDATPGNAILMRAPGFKGEDVRPFHFVSEISLTRYSFGMRNLRSFA
jgi:hypothetical protein